jgi:type I restriction enzyme R subunit
MTPVGVGAPGYSEGALIERPAIALFEQLGWQAINAYTETFGSTGTLGRETDLEVVLLSRLRAALTRLNPGLPAEAVTAATEELTRARSAMSAEAANREVYRLLKGRVEVTFRDADGAQVTENVNVIDWRTPANNDFLLVSQFWVRGDVYRRRCDLVGFVNGLPLVFIELKASHRRLEQAYRDNLRDYRSTVPALFWHNGLIILSNGSESRIGSTTAAWEHFGEWKRINDEGEQGVVSLETMIRGTCEPARLLDIVENFTAFEESKGGLIKKLGRNHQVLGVNRAIQAVRDIQSNKGRLGVFWHTQGSGKSVSMVFFAQKILRTLPGNWTFVVVTDRQELDDQIYKTFVACGAVTEEQAQAQSGEDLKRLLTEDHRFVFTLIQKFHTDKGQRYPVLSTRSDIIVVTDEAHRSQYDTFALNMRSALPNAAFIGFTGTPLMVGEEKTKEVFGDYISIYNFKQSVDDGATVPLYYENRIPELQLTNQDLNADMEALLEAAELDEQQQEKLEREFAREYHLITRDDRLETVAEDLVRHFMGRGQQGKAMVVCIDKATAIRMYDKTRRYWEGYLADLREKLTLATFEERSDLEARIAYMIATDMAVVVSQSQNEVEDLRQKGLDIVPHRHRMLTEDLDTKFKDPNDPFRIVFVCAMWMTGFDVPCCSTIYLDKPMRNHTLMQTIARANRVFRDKVNGLIVDYVGVFRNLQKALAVYAAPKAGGDGEDDPIKSKAELVGLLRQALAEATGFCHERGVRPEAILKVDGFERVRLLDDAVEAIIVNDESKRRFLLLVSNVVRLYKAILPDPAATEFAPTCTLLAVLAEKIRALMPAADITEVMQQVETVLDRSVAAESYVITAARETPPPYGSDRLVDLSRIDFDKLRQQFEKARKRTEVERLRGQLNAKMQAMIALNKARVDFAEKFQRMIDEYNAGSLNIEELFERLVRFAQSLNAEERRGVAEGLTEEELALFDLLTKPDPTLSKAEEAQVKKVARTLLETLKRERLVLDWRKRQQSRQAVRVCIEEVLDKLPPAYAPEVYQRKCDLTYQHVYDAYFGEGRSIYSQAA